MRTLVQPPRTLHCDFCHGELRLERIDPDGPFLDLDIETFVCVKCGHTKIHSVIHDRYVTHTASKTQTAKAG